MTISSPGVKGVLRAYGGQKVALKEPKDTAKTKAPGQDQVVLSAQARDLKQALAIVAKSSAVRKHKVAELTNAVRQGIYRVDPDKVAASLFTAVRECGREV